jgi:hypothetical protein
MVPKFGSSLKVVVTYLTELITIALFVHKRVLRKDALINFTIQKRTGEAIPVEKTMR